MSKKKKHKKTYNDGMYDQEELERVAGYIKDYVDGFRYVIIENISEEDYKYAMKVLKKFFKNAKEGRGDKIYDPKRYREFMERLERKEDDEWKFI